MALQRGFVVEALVAEQRAKPLEPFVVANEQIPVIVAELVPQAFRDHLALGYEIVKWDGDLGRPSVYQPLTTDLAEAKVVLLQQHYGSQRSRPWYDREAFLGLARIRGIECKAHYAEAFHVNKLVLDLAGG